MKNRKKGFTLVELLAVIVVLGIVLVLVAPTAMSAFYKARSGLNEMEKGIVIDAAKLYLTDLDVGKKKFVYQGSETLELNNHTYNKGDTLSTYDFRVYASNNNIDVDIRTLVEGGYYDELCSYSAEGYEGRPSPGCKIQEECVLSVRLDYEKSPDGVYYVTKGYQAEIVKGCDK